MEKCVILHWAWCPRSHLRCHPWWVSSAFKPECFCCVLKCEIWAPFICLQQRFRSSWSAMQDPDTRYKCYHKNEEYRTDLLHQHIASTYLLQPTTIIPPVQRMWKKLCQCLDHNRIAIKREQQNWHQQDWWILTGLMFSFLLWSVTPPLGTIKKNSCHGFSLSPTGTAEKLPFKPHSLIT